MIKYEYTYDNEKVTRTVSETYPELSVLDESIKNRVEPDLAKAKYLKALEGKAEAKYITIEEDWFNAHNAVVKLETEYKELTDKLEKDLEVSEDDENKLKDEDIEVINNRIKILDGDIVEFINDLGVVDNIVTEGLLSSSVKNRNDLEAKNPWLLKYRGVETDVERPVVEVKIGKSDRKKLIAYERDIYVRNSEDSIADLAKMISLAFSTISSIWESLDDDAKSSIDPDKKAMIDYSVAKFALTETRADAQLAEEGTKLVDKLFDREVNINSIITKHK